MVQIYSNLTSITSWCLFLNKTVPIAIFWKLCYSPKSKSSTLPNEFCLLEQHIQMASLKNDPLPPLLPKCEDLVPTLVWSIAKIFMGRSVTNFTLGRGGRRRPWGWKTWPCEGPSSRTQTSCTAASSTPAWDKAFKAVVYHIDIS